jgi:hypothetical protein
LADSDVAFGVEINVAWQSVGFAHTNSICTNSGQVN